MNAFPGAGEAALQHLMNLGYSAKAALETQTCLAKSNAQASTEARAKCRQLAVAKASASVDPLAKDIDQSEFVNRITKT